MDKIVWCNNILKKISQAGLFHVDVLEVIEFFIPDTYYEGDILVTSNSIAANKIKEIAVSAGLICNIC